jgi:aerobic carbon-monoxide dehydrogenase medium subunit
MKAVSFAYVRPKDTAEALAAVARTDGGAKFIAGGQSLGPMLNLRLARPQLLVDIGRLAALRNIEDKGSAWRIGAGVTHARLEDLRGQLPGSEMLCEVAAGIAYRSVRNRGTIGGSLVHADPAADWPLALAALGATVNVRSAKGSRAVPADRFMKGAFTTELGEDEIVETIDVPKLSGAGRYGYYKFCRKTGEFAEASAAAVFDPQVGAARIFFGALRSTSLPLPGLARRVAEGSRAAASKDAVTQALSEAAPDLDAIERRMATAAVARALDRVFAP